MTDNTDPNASSVSDLSTSSANSEKDPTPKTVDYASFQKSVDQEKGLRKRVQENATLMLEQANINKELQAKLDGIKATENEIADKKMREKGQWDKLLDAKVQEVEKYKSERDQATEAFTEAEKLIYNSAKLKAVEDMLPGKFKNPAYSQFIDVESVAMNPETGEIDMETVKAVTDNFLTEHKDLLDTKTFKGLPGSAAGMGGTGNAAEKFKNADLKDMRALGVQAIIARKKQLGIPTNN